MKGGARMTKRHKKMKHTPEPWVLVDETSIRSKAARAAPDLKASDEEWLGRDPTNMDYPSNWLEVVNLRGAMGGDDTTADAERIVECVNACAGIESPMEAIREAREALQWTIREVERLSKGVDGTEYQLKMDDKAREALAKLTNNSL